MEDTMTKYIDASKLKAEIERLKSTNPSEYNYQNAEGYTWALDDLLSFIDTLSEEPDKSLEEEISRTYHDGSVADTDDMNHVTYENIARHFAEWQKKQIPMPEDTVIFNKGIEEGKRLMMEEAIKCEYDQYPAAIYLPAPIPRMNKGDIVRIIVLPKEEEE